MKSRSIDSSMSVSLDVNDKFSLYDTDTNEGECNTCCRIPFLIRILLIFLL